MFILLLVFARRRHCRFATWFILHRRFKGAFIVDMNSFIRYGCHGGCEICGRVTLILSRARKSYVRVSHEQAE